MADKSVTKDMGLSTNAPRRTISLGRELRRNFGGAFGDAKRMASANEAMNPNLADHWQEVCSQH